MSAPADIRGAVASVHARQVMQKIEALGDQLVEAGIAYRLQSHEVQRLREAALRWKETCERAWTREDEQVTAPATAPVDTHRAKELSEACTDCRNGSCCVEARAMLRSMADELDEYRKAGTTEAVLLLFRDDRRRWFDDQVKRERARSEARRAGWSVSYDENTTDDARYPGDV